MKDARITSCEVPECFRTAVSAGCCEIHAEMRAAARRLTQRMGAQIEAEFRSNFYDACWASSWEPFDERPAGKVLSDARAAALEQYACIYQAEHAIAEAVAALDDAYHETVSTAACAYIDRARKALTGVMLRRDPKPPPGPSSDRTGKDFDMVSHEPDATGHPGDHTTDRDYGDEGPDDDSPAADARFRSLAAEPDTDLINRLASLEKTVQDLAVRNRDLEGTVGSMRAQNARLARRVDGQGG